MTTRSPVTIADVARHAGVSTATVSFVLNKTKTVTAEVRDRVLSSTQELGYQPSHAARALRTGKTATIGLIIPDLTNPFFPKLAQDVEREAAALGYAVLLADSHDDLERQARAIQNMEGKNVDMMLVIPALGTLSLPATAVPLVILDRSLPGQNQAGQDHAGQHLSVSSDEFSGGQQAAAHLLGLGHTTFAVLAGPAQAVAASAEVRSSGGYSRRVQGMLSALQSAGIPESATVLVHSDYTAEGGRQATQDLLHSEQVFTAMLATSDTLALGALSALQHAGKRVPQDVSLVGFDDIPWAALSFPALTTVRQQTAELAKQAVALALSSGPASLSSGTASPSTLSSARPSLVPTQLVVRGSCGPAGGTP
ncbi:LacI family DNA-binding transcriptional regulator [Deinococcus sp. UYEF24]